MGDGIRVLIDELQREHDELKRQHPVRAWFWSRWNTVRYQAKEFRYRLRWIRWGWQRARRGYSTYDTWSFDRYIARVVGHGLIDLRDNTHSYPVDSTPQEWGKLLTEVAEPLLKYVEEEPLDRTPAETQEVYDQAVVAMRLFAEHFGDMWD